VTPLPDDFHALARKVNNWGRWGDDDEIGTLNFITDSVVAAAASLVRTGKRFSLAMPLGLGGPQTGLIPGRLNPLRTMIAINQPLTGDPAGFCHSDDVVVMGLQAATTRTTAGSTTVSRSRRSRPRVPRGAASTKSARWSRAACCSTSRGRVVSSGSPVGTP
jgi:hypothetical protein